MENERTDVRRAWLALAALSLGFFMSLLDQATVAVALPQIAADWGIDYAQAAWVSSAYLLAVVVPLPVTGRMGDTFGHRRMFLAGVALFTAAATSAALMPTYPLLVVARLAQGLGAAMLMPQAMAVINQIFPRERRGAAFGVWGVVGAAAGFAGPVLAGLIVSSVGWRGIFLLHLPVGIVALILASRWVPTLPQSPARLDLVSVALSFLGIGAIVFSVQEGLNTLGLRVLAAVGVAFFVAFLLRQRREDALVPLRLFRSRNFVIGTATIVVMGVVVSAQLIPIMAWLQDTRGLSPEQSGLVATPMAVVGFVLGPVCGFLSDRVHPRVMHVTGFAIIAASQLAMYLAMRQDYAIVVVLAAVAGLGVGQSFIWAANAAAVLGELQPTDMGAASGVYNTSRQLGGVLGVAAVGLLLGSAGPAPAMLLLAGVVTVGLVVAAGFTTGRGSEQALS